MANQPKNYKKFVATAATATLVASAIVPVASAASFSDIEGNTHADAIKALSDAGIIKGYEDGTFKPNAEISRGQTVKLLGRWLETKGYSIPADWNTVQRFNDLPVNAADSELVKYAALVKDAGVFNGSNGNLNYSQPMQRQQMALVLVRAIKTVEGLDLVQEYKAAGYTSKIKDLDKAYSTENVEAITALEYAGITVVENFNPTNAITRGQFSSFLYRTINYEAPVKELKVESVSAINSKQIAVTFNKDVSKLDLKPQNFEVTNLSVTDVKVEGKVVTLTVSTDFSSGTTYTVKVSGLKDENGNPINDLTASFLYSVEQSKELKLAKTDFTIYPNSSKYENIFDYVTATIDGKAVSESLIEQKILETNNTNVVVAADDIDNEVIAGDIIGAGSANVNIKYKLKDGTVLETGVKTIKVVVQYAANAAGFHLAKNDMPNNTVEFEALRADGENRTVIYANDTATDYTLGVFGYDNNKDPLTEEIKSKNAEVVKYEVTSGGSLLQVNPSNGEVLFAAKKEGKATVKATRGSFSYNANVELRNYPEVKEIALNRTALVLAEDQAGDTDLVDESLKSAEFDVILKDQYKALFKDGNTNNDNNVTISIDGTPTVEKDKVEINVTYNNGNETKTGKIVVTTDSNKLDLSDSNSLSINNSVLTGLNVKTKADRNVTADENVDVYVKFYDTTVSGKETLVSSQKLPVTIKDIGEVTALKVFKSNDLDATDDPTATIELWEVDAQGDKIRPVKQGVKSINRGADLSSPDDDVVISTNDEIEFTFDTDNSVIKKWVTPATSPVANNAEAKVTYSFAEGAETLFGENGKITVSTKVGANKLAFGTIDVAVKNSREVAYKVSVKNTKPVVDLSELEKLTGQKLIKDVLFGVANEDQYIFDDYNGTVKSIAIKNGSTGYKFNPIIELVSQNNVKLPYGPAILQLAQSDYGKGAVAINNSVIPKTQNLKFEFTVISKDGVEIDGTDESATFDLATDKEQGTAKILLTKVTRSNDTTVTPAKNLLAEPVVIELTVTR